jgi:hypothetical protein
MTRTEQEKITTEGSDCTLLFWSMRKKEIGRIRYAEKQKSSGLTRRKNCGHMFLGLQRWCGCFSCLRESICRCLLPFNDFVRSFDRVQRHSSHDCDNMYSIANLTDVLQLCLMLHCVRGSHGETPAVPWSWKPAQCQQHLPISKQSTILSPSFMIFISCATSAEVRLDPPAHIKLWKN